jgi:pimeloyl-ACP methyl ester carboxylesterase
VEENTYEYANIVSFNYRGYGNSTGSPSEKALFDDALLIYDFLVTDKHIKPENIIVMGRSLGSGVATYLASQKPVKKVILVTPYDSIESVAKESYGFVPVSLLLQNKFDSTLYANLRNNELLCIYGGMDTVVPNSHTERLLTFWKGSVQKVFLSNANHNSILSFNQVQTAIDEFVQ